MKRQPIALPAAEISATWDPRRGAFKPGSIIARPALLVEGMRPDWAEARARVLELSERPAPIVQTRRRLVDGIRRIQHLARRSLQPVLGRRA